MEQGANADPASAGELDAMMEQIIGQHEAALLRYAGRMLREPSAAQDVVQEAFIRLFKAWSPGLAAADYIRRWLYRVTHNLAVDYIRRESRLRVLHQQHATEVQDARGAGPNADLAREEAMETALYHLRRLKPEERQVVILRLQEGLSYREISAIIGKTETNVGFILHQAVKKIAAGRTRPGAPGKEAAP